MNSQWRAINKAGGTLASDKRGSIELIQQLVAMNRCAVPLCWRFMLHLWERSLGWWFGLNLRPELGSHFSIMDNTYASHASLHRVYTLSLFRIRISGTFRSPCVRSVNNVRYRYSISYLKMYLCCCIIDYLMEFCDYLLSKNQYGEKIQRFLYS